MSGKSSSSSIQFQCQEMELRRGPWTLEEDTLLIHYIACHGEGRWNLLARSSGLKRTGKSCRLRWLNYLKPDIKRGNLSPEEQLLILELHSKWGNRWSRIAQYLPGRTDNEIKNYWRTRVQKQARQLRVDANSSVFRDAVRCYWMPRLLEKTSAAAAAAAPSLQYSSLPPPAPPPQYFPHQESTGQPSHDRDGSQLIIPSLPQFSCSIQHELDPFQSNYTHGYGLEPTVATSDTVTFDPPFNNCTGNSSDIISKTNGHEESVWGVDELYDMLRGYMEYKVEDHSFRRPLNYANHCNFGD